MIKNTSKAIKDYTEAYEQAMNVHKQVLKHIRTNYKEGSEVYDNAMRVAKNTFSNAVGVAKDAQKEIAKEEFRNIKEAIKKAVATSPSADIGTYVNLIKEGKLSDTEIQIILDSHKGNYMDSKLIHGALEKPFGTVETLLSGVEKVESMVGDYFKTYEGESLANMTYNNALIQNGSIIGEIGKMANDFISTYNSVPEGGE